MIRFLKKLYYDWFYGSESMTADWLRRKSIDKFRKLVNKGLYKDIKYWDRY